MKTPTEKVAIYGGAFNPPTLAHEQVVSEVLQNSEITRVIISPSGERYDKDFGINEKQRAALIEAYIELLQKSGLNISLDTYFFEGKNKGFTTTAQEEEYFRNKLGPSPYFIFGNDVAGDMSDWLGNEKKFIETKLKKIFLKRPGYEFDFHANGFDNYMLLDIPDMLKISSSIAREMVRNKQSVKGILHPEIERSISENNITYN